MTATSSNGGQDPIPPPYNKAEAISNSIDLLIIIQAQHLLEDIDNTLIRDMRWCKIFYGIHFPELDKIINNNTLYFKVVRRIGNRKNLPNVDLSDLLSPVLKLDIIKAAITSIGLDISDEEIEEIHSLCDHITTTLHNRAYLYNLLQRRMTSLVPNLTALIGAKLGAKIIVHSGSLMRLAILIDRMNKPSNDNRNVSRNITNTSNHDGECNLGELKNKGAKSAAQCDMHGEGVATEERKVEANDDTDVGEDSEVQSSEDNDHSPKKISGDESDDEESESEIEEKPTKGALKENQQN